MHLKIRLGQPKKDHLGSQLEELIKVLKKIERNPAAHLDFDFEQISFIEPVFISTISALISDLRKKGHVVSTSNINYAISDYIYTIYFPDGLRPDDFSNWQDQLDHYSGKSYLPILNFPTSTQKPETEIRDKLLSKAYQLLHNNLSGVPVSYKSAINFLISEMTNNIIDHADVDRGWVKAQYYQTKNFLDICVIDTGKTILGSYQDTGFERITNDTEAIRRATEGVSTKSQERGYGISTSKKMITKGLKGKFVIVSGGGLLYNNKLIELPVRWNGTIFALRILSNQPNFNYINYVE